MYKKTCGIIAVTILLIICGSIWFLSASVTPAFAATFDIAVSQKLISIQPTGPLFNMENMAPGYTGHSTLTVKNSGDASFPLALDSLKESGDESLFKGLIITVKNYDDTISYYNGSLKDLQNVNIGSISQGGEEKYNLSVNFPTSMGNEFQQKKVSVRFIFTAYSDGTDTTEIIDEDVPGVSGPTNETGQTENSNNNGGNENIPLDRIPKTGETPPQLLYYFGILMAVIGLKLGMKIRREA